MRFNGGRDSCSVFLKDQRSRPPAAFCFNNWEGPLGCDVTSKKEKRKKKRRGGGCGGWLFTDPKQFRKHKKSYQLRGPFKHPMHVKCLNRVFQCLWVERGTILCMSSSYSCHNSNKYKVHPSKSMLWLFIIFWIKPFVKKCLNHMSWKPFAMLFFFSF